MSALDEREWRVARVGRVANINTPALYLNRIEGCTVWRPCETKKTFRGGRSRKPVLLTVPIFGKYVFLNIARRAVPQALAVRVSDTPVLSCLIESGGGLSVVPDREIEKLRDWIDETIANDRDPLPVISVEPGDEVKLRGGPFDGFAGLVESLGDGHARVLAGIFGRPTPVTVPLHSLEAVSA